MALFPISQHSMRKGALVLVSAVLVMLFLSACGGDPQAQQQASQNKSAFDNEVAHAQSIGIPASLLTPITSQATQLDATSAPFGLFNDQSVTSYNSNLAQRYQMLTLETKGLELGHEIADASFEAVRRYHDYDRAPPIPLNQAGLLQIRQQRRRSIPFKQRSC